MNSIKTNILNKHCYTELVYQRINKKLKTAFSKGEIEILIYEILLETNEHDYRKTGKNFYIINTSRNITITINSYTYRIITVTKQR